MIGDTQMYIAKSVHLSFKLGTAMSVQFINGDQARSLTHNNQQQSNSSVGSILW